MKPSPKVPIENAPIAIALRQLDICRQRRAPLPPPRSAARRGAACGARRRPAGRGRDRRRSRRARPSRDRVYRVARPWQRGFSTSRTCTSAPTRGPRGRSVARPSWSSAAARADRRERGSHPPRAPRAARAGGGFPARARAAPVVAVPGNHDIPYTFPARFTQPWAEFERLWETTSPVHVSDGVCLVGINSVRPVAPPVGRRPRRPAPLGGGAARGRAARRPARRRDAPPADRSAVADAEAAGRAAQPRARPRSSTRARSWWSRGTPTRARSPSGTSSRCWSENQRGVSIATAPGFGQPRPHRRGEARGLLVYEADERSLARPHVHLAGRGLGPDGRAAVPARNCRARLVQANRLRAPEQLSLGV